MLARQELDNAAIVVADNVTEYYYAGTDQEVWHLRNDFPCLMPPAPSLWIETRAPSRIVSRERGVQPSYHPGAWGIVFQTMPAQDHRGEFAHLFQERSPWSDLHPDAKWVVMGVLLIEHRKGLVFGPMAWWVIELDDQGQAIVDDPDVRVLEVVSVTDEKVARGFSATFLKPLLLAISFMHCKNVTTRTEVPPPKLSKAHQRRHGKPLTRYQVIDIHPFREAVQRAGGGRTGRQQALHQVRGHFKTYTTDNPLFGRHVGRWFWAQHIAGALEEGVVDKEYRIQSAGRT